MSQKFNRWDLKRALKLGLAKYLPFSIDLDPQTAKARATLRFDPQTVQARARYSPLRKTQKGGKSLQNKRS